ncbi:hypothetical protein AB0M79_28510 [Polymorphospora sp. NPDC051019]|uniref:hypothetical protein n=1 Tax=Polymorphospora sp. NPDC051019 TaxID=3155725 RepID=UPI00342FA7B9
MFQETAGFTPAKIKGGQLWVKPTNIITPTPLVLSSPVADLPTGIEMALALAISADPTEDVRRHIASTGLNLPIITAYLPGGVSNASVTSCDHAYGFRWRSATSLARLPGP